MPEDVINELIAANVPTVDLSLCGCGDIDADLDADFDISNDFTATATSGDATVSDNTIAGNATSGNAETQVTVFNLTGRTVIGHSALLVFVNVAGEWIGFITDAPSGATAAMLGSGVTQNMQTGYGEADFDIDTSATIRNNVNVTAVSGDAEVSNNTRAGNATTGDAYAAANVSNITGSHFGFSGWFGLLFINVFGDWRGSFGTDTMYGGMAGLPSTNTPPTNQPGPSVAAAQTTTSHASPHSGKVRTFALSFNGSPEDGSAMLATATEVSPEDIGQIAETSFGASQPANNRGLLIFGGILLLAYLIIFRPDFLSAFRRRD